MAAKRRASSRAGGKMGAVLGALVKAYGRAKPPSGETSLDRAVLAAMINGMGERPAIRMVNRLRECFVDWNEVRVARPRELDAAVPDASDAQLKRLQSFLQSLYEQFGGLDQDPFGSRRSQETRSLLAEMKDFSRAEADAVMLLASGVPVIPATEDVTRVLRRLGAVPRNATRSRAQKAAMRALSPDEYRIFYGLASEHAAGVCREELPDCRRCRLSKRCHSRGRW